MFRVLVYCLFLLLWSVCLDCDTVKDRPKIITIDGDLILQPAIGKRIYLRPNGENSGIFVGDVNILNTTANEKISYAPISDGDLFSDKINNISQRLDLLEQSKSNFPISPSFRYNNFFRRKVNTLQTRVGELERRINLISTDDCLSNPCKHGGTCLDLASGYHCVCPDNWEGKDCNDDVNECRNFAGTDLGCQNSARCVNTPGSYECVCGTGWYGIHCTKREKDCNAGSHEMCGHGTCISVNSGQGIKCICDQGWTTNGTSETCTTDINECDGAQGQRCSVNPKVDCINLPGTFRCGQCPVGYEGDGFICSDVNECLIDNGGCSISPMVTCHNTMGSRICSPCPPGYQGDGVICTWRGSCNINHGGCHPSAHCIENALGSQCICPEGMVGDGVGLNGCYVSSSSDNSTCTSNTCGMNGQCIQLRAGYTCVCLRGFSGAHCDIITNSCGNNPCRNGGSCIRDDNSLRGFRCECTALYRGSLCHISSNTCGGVLDGLEGNIVYPLTNSSYNSNVKCAWVIRTTDKMVINVTFSKFDLETSVDCKYDFLQIHDGQNAGSQLINRFCGSDLPNEGNIVSSHNSLYLWFRSDDSVSKNGFALHWNSIPPVCGGVLNATTHGHINSPGWPGKYPPNRDCYWHLKTNFGKRLELHFFQFDIEAHPNCSFDFLAIYDGNSDRSPLLNKYCNSTQPAPVQSASSEVYIHFHSDALNSGNGFQISYASAEGVPGCGGYYTRDKGEISAPSYNGRYLNDLLCEYKIQAKEGTKIQVTFKSFKLERSIRCKFDYLKVYDGPSQESPLIGTYCGYIVPRSFVTTTNSLFMIFKSDRSDALEGFKIDYKVICRQEIQGDSGIIKSPNYPFNYPENTMCEYILGTKPGKAIELHIQDFELEKNEYYNCNFDFIELRDGINSNSKLLGRYCGSSRQIPHVFVSSLNHMYVKFKSDFSLTGRGFYANYTTIDIKCGGIYRQPGVINFPSNGQRYANNESCTWVLVAPEGMVISLIWNRFKLETMPRCSSDYLSLIETSVENNVSEVIGKFCGKNYPPTITTTSNYLELQFHSDLSVTREGFSVTYSFLEKDSYCGGSYVKTQGYIYSPGWPNRYEANKDCSWIITVPVGQQIVLNITEMYIELPIREKCNAGDWLEIRDGNTVNGSLIDRICGKVSNRRYTSLGNSLFIHFHSDAYISGKGFMLHWDGSIVGCGGVLTSTSGLISSPNYPNAYHDNAECFYRIVTNPGTRISIHFKDIDLEKHYRLKCIDYIKVFDGRDENANLLGKLCELLPNATTFETTTNYAFLKFSSDAFDGGRGFLLSYNTICNSNITGSYGIIESPGFPNAYQPNLNCLWRITVPKGNKINITFTHFNIRDLSYVRRMSLYPYLNRNNCTYEYLQTKEGDDVNFSNRYCGSFKPLDITTSTNSIQIKFVTTQITFPGHNTGFRLEWVKYGCGGHIQKDYGTISTSTFTIPSGELECEWLIEVSVGYSMSLTLQDLFMQESENCTVDSIEIYNGRSVLSPLINRNCHKGPLTLTSTSNCVLLKLVKRSNFKDIRFNIRFNKREGICGGNTYSKSGIILSPNYPQNYDNNLNCVWSISVPKNHRIEINFENLDLYNLYDDDQECKDYIKFYNHTLTAYFDRYNNMNGLSSLNSNNSILICPNTNVSRITSDTNSMVMQFITDGQGTAKGFKANFTMTCGALITAVAQGVIESEKFMSHTNRSCIWTIMASELFKKITLTITHLSLSKNRNGISQRDCSSSFLRVYDGSDTNAPLFDEYCGMKAPPSITSHGSAITIELGTYTDKIDGQFSAHYSTLDSACGGKLTSEEGTIASPNYPQSYPSNTTCVWILQTSPGNKVYAVFEMIDLELSDGCNEDYVEIREKNGLGPLLGLYCGNQVPINTTSETELYIRFHSNELNSGKGFLLHYGFLHGNEIYGQNEGVITSPLFPKTYEGSGVYSWRIVLNRTSAISIHVQRLEIPTNGDICTNKLSVFNGYDDSSSLLEDICGIVVEPRVIETVNSAIYIKLTIYDNNPGLRFKLLWNSLQNDEDITDASEKNCGFNATKRLQGSEYSLSSPNYPNNYDDNLNCEWIFETSVGRHLDIYFNDIDLEQSSNCVWDHISIYSSNTLATWKPIAENICLSSSEKQYFNSSTYLKVKFRSDYALTSKGFQAVVRSLCGGERRDLSGVIWPLYSDVRRYETKCNWKIIVRPSRKIRLTFELFNITNSKDDCNTYVTIHNGESSESPFLGSGKYCGYSHENRSELVSSSNVVFVSYVLRGTFKTFKLFYSEKYEDCGFTSKLDSSHNWEIITTPNYPSIPNAYTECVWKLSGPTGEILRVDFIDRFNLETSPDCSNEFLEIRDGSSQISPLKGRYCSKIPGTVKSSDNNLYIKYSTQLLIPGNGFKLNVSIDVCGGTIIANSGEVTSPGFPNMNFVPYGSVCEWRIKSNPGMTLSITPQTINLSATDTPCATKIVILESINNNITELKTFCRDDFDDSTSIKETIETDTNEVVIQYHVSKEHNWFTDSESKGFRFTFKSTNPSCGGDITTPEGYVSTPHYPVETTIRYCRWNIVVPDKTRRVKVELIDFNEDKQIFGFHNDMATFSPIKSNNDSRTYESSGNTITFYVWLEAANHKHRFKAKFSSNEPALCGGSLTGISGELNSPDLHRSYQCKWYYSPGVYDQLQNNNNSYYKSINVRVISNSSSSSTVCRMLNPVLIVTADFLGANSLDFTKKICGNTEVLFTVPSTRMNLVANVNNNKYFNFHLEWKLQPCGGIIDLTKNLTNELNIPVSHNYTLNCAWILKSPYRKKISISLTGTFQFDCDSQYIKISRAFQENLPIIADYCRNRMPETPLVGDFTGLLVQYHSEAINQTNIILTAQIEDSYCGGILTKYLDVFWTPNFPNNYNPNQECIWMISTELGNRVSLSFIDRFAIEAQPNCTKDVLIIYDWKNEDYVEMARLCGRNLPPVFNSTFNRMKVVFRSDDQTNLEGFRAKWKNICGGNFVATEKEQFLYSPNYGFGYQSNLNCVYRITSPRRPIIINFIDFELEGTYPDCNYDNLTVKVNEAYSYTSSNTYCGTKSPPQLVSENEFEIIFRSDAYVQRRGFYLSYRIDQCGGEVQEQSVIKSGFSSSYGNNLNCTWVIKAPVNKVAVINFKYIDLENSENCNADYIALYNGLVSNDMNRIALICGLINSTNVFKGDNTMLLQFITDQSVSSGGFEAQVTFTLSESQGCGGNINLTSSQKLKSPLINGSFQYENFLDCIWYIEAPIDHIIKLEFTVFHVASCLNVNQTALGPSNCDCDFVEIKDGINPDSYIIATYCGHSLVPILSSTNNRISIRLHTDGELNSSGFEVNLSVEQSACGQSLYTPTSEIQTIRTAGYPGAIPRGFHCAYHIRSSDYKLIHLKVNYIDLSPQDSDGRCDKDKVIIKSGTRDTEATATGLVMKTDSQFFTQDFTDQPQLVELCGKKQSVDFYGYNNVDIYVQTDSEPVTSVYKGVEIQLHNGNMCSKNFTGLHGRFKLDYFSQGDDSNCTFMIIAPENFTISIYFLNIYDTVEVYNGNNIASSKTVRADGNSFPFFSTGRYALVVINSIYSGIDLNYVTTDKGPGCGGKITNTAGIVTSPLYPETYRRRSSCEWELETSVKSRLYLNFDTFDMGISCDQNFLMLVDSSGNTVSTYCDEVPASYTSPDNYVKLVFTTTMNNGGTGWVARFRAVDP